MSKIHRPPRGLQHLLGSQSFGKNPDELAQTVQPTVSLDGMYSAELLKTQSVIGALAAQGQVGSITFAAPVALIACGIESGTALAANENMAFNVRLDGLGGTNENVIIASEGRAYFETGAYPTFGHSFPFPLVVPGGAEISGYLASYAGNLLTLTFRVLYVDLNPIADV